MTSDPSRMLERAIIAHRGGELEAAERLYRLVLDREPDTAAALNNLGILLSQRGVAGECEELFRRAIAVRPDDAGAHANLGTLLLEAGRTEAAIAAFEQAIATRPDHAETQLKLGLALMQKGDAEAALPVLERAVALQPESATARFWRGNALLARGNAAKAAAAYRDAIDLAPDVPAFHARLGVALYRLEQLDEAAIAYRRALELAPQDGEALANLAVALAEAGDLEGAIACSRQALALDPNHVEAHLNLALLLLLNGDFRAGWQEYEWRPQPKNGAAPRWRGEDLAGKTVLLQAEQGFGDTFQFARFAGVLAARGARVVLAAAPELVAVLRSTAGAAEVVGAGATLPGCDFSLPMMSVAAVLDTTEGTIPGAVPYLAADPRRVAMWRERLGQAGFKVGIVWQGRPAAAVDRGRSVPLAFFAPLAAVPGVRLISLQKIHGLDQLERLPPGMRVETLGLDFEPGPDAFLDSAAVILGLDLVIACDTAAAHLAGALGRPVWIALQTVPDWRWQLGRADSPWYPTARLYRQRRRGDWAEVFWRIAADLAEAARRRPRDME